MPSKLGFFVQGPQGPKRTVSWDNGKKVLNNIPYATAKALTNVAKIAQEKQKDEMRLVFDRPTNFVLNSIGVQFANKSTQKSAVYIKRQGAKFLAHHIKGGARVPKGYEKKLRSIGALPAGWFAVPGTGAKFDANGNWSRSQMNEVLAYLNAHPESAKFKNYTDTKRQKLAKGTKNSRGRSYFVGSPGDGRLPVGVWERTQTGFGSAVKPILIFVDRVNYRAVFDFEKVAKKAFQDNFSKEVAKAMTDATRLGGT